MKEKALKTAWILFIINMFMLIGYFSSCDKRGDTTRAKINVSKPANNIVGRSEQQKEVAKEAADIAPDISPEMDTIIDLSNYNIEDAKAILDQQKKIGSLEESLVNEKKAHANTKENLEKAHKNTLVKILGCLVAAGLLALAGGIGLIAFTFYTQQKFSKMGLIIAVSGGAIAGLGIFTIYYLKTIAITVGIMVVIVIVIAILKAIAMSKAQKESHKEKKINKELMSTFHMTDKAQINKEQSTETQLRVAEHKVTERNVGE